MSVDLDKKALEAACEAYKRTANYPCFMDALSAAISTYLSALPEDVAGQMERLEKLARWADSDQHERWCRRPSVPVHGFSGEGVVIREAASTIQSLSASLAAAEGAIVERYTRLQMAGGAMANILYNLKQGEFGTERIREQMDEAQRAWDDALFATTHPTTSPAGDHDHG